MSSFTLTTQNEKKYQALLKRYPKKDSLSLPLLWMAQYQDGYISSDAMRFIADKLDKNPAEIFSVASFYTMFKLSPIGNYHIEVCKTLSCKLCGKDEILKHLESKHNIKPNQTTADGKFTLTTVECMGACAGAPMMTLNEVYHEKITPAQIDELLGKLS